MSINTGRVVMGGAVAGVIRLAGDGIVTGLILADMLRAETVRINPALPVAMDSAATKASVVAINILLGIASIYLYAAMRPRFAAGPQTAVRAGVTTWAIAALGWGMTVVLGIFTVKLWMARVVLALPIAIVAARGGAALYREGPREHAAPFPATTRTV